MGNIYVRSTDGNDADNGSTWALAKATLAGAAGIDAAGDVIYVSDAHSESSATAQTIALAGTATNPVRVICGDDAAEPPTAVSAAGVVATTGASSITISGSAYVYGLTIRAGSAANNASITLGSNDAFQSYEACVFELGNTNNSGRINIGLANYAGDSRTEFKSCQFKLGNTGQAVLVFGRVLIAGGAFASGTSTPTNGAFNIEASGEWCGLTIEGFDFSNLASTVNLIRANTAGPGIVIIRNSKLPASWTGSLISSTIGKTQTRVEMYNCDSSDTNYTLNIVDFYGSILNEGTIVRTGGANDGTNSLSWKMTTGSGATYPHSYLASPEIVRWNETTGSSITVTVEIITDNVTLTDAECWLEVQYLGTSGVPLGSFVTDAKADVLATAANQSTSSEMWTTTGLTTPVKQKLSVTFTPQQKGFIHAVVKLAKASSTVYVDPVLTVT